MIKSIDLFTKNRSIKSSKEFVNMILDDLKKSRLSRSTDLSRTIFKTDLLVSCHYFRLKNAFVSFICYNGNGRKDDYFSFVIFSLVVFFFCILYFYFSVLEFGSLGIMEFSLFFLFVVIKREIEEKRLDDVRWEMMSPGDNERKEGIFF